MPFTVSRTAHTRVEGEVFHFYEYGRSTPTTPQIYCNVRIRWSFQHVVHHLYTIIVSMEPGFEPLVFSILSSDLVFETGFTTEQSSSLDIVRNTVGDSGKEGRGDQTGIGST